MSRGGDVIQVGAGILVAGKQRYLRVIVRTGHSDLSLGNLDIVLARRALGAVGLGRLEQQILRTGRWDGGRRLFRQAVGGQRLAGQEDDAGLSNLDAPTGFLETQAGAL